MPDTMIVNRLSRILGERRISIAELQRQTGLSYVTLHSLYSDKSTRIDFATLDKICRALGVGTGDVLEYQPDPVVMSRPTGPGPRDDGGEA